MRELCGRAAEGCVVGFTEGVSCESSETMRASADVCVLSRTQVYVEADAKMDTYQAQDGSNRTQLNLLMRISPSLHPCRKTIAKLTYSQATSKLSPVHAAPSNQSRLQTLPSKNP